MFGLSIKKIGVAIFLVSCGAILTGFGTAGIAAGSIAAYIQSGIGCVGASSSFSILTSLGMKGIFVSGAKYSTGLVTLDWIYEKLFKREEEPRKHNKVFIAVQETIEDKF